ncbi:MAG: AI-2E family transporter [Nitrosomonadaceae bacterium]
MKNLNDNRSIELLIRIGFLILLIAASLMILAPFMIILIWGVIIAIAQFPLFKKSVNALGNKKTLTAVLFTLAGLIVIIIPSLMLAESSASGYQNLLRAFEEGRLTIPPPTENVNEWPLIGENLYNIWGQASNNLLELLSEYNGQHSEQVKEFIGWLLKTLTSIGLTFLQFIVSIIIAGVLLAKADMGAETAKEFAKRLVGDNAEDFINLTIGTIRSVVQGILGVALIQALASVILLIIFNVPLPGLWALFVLILATVQLSPLLILGPISIYVFSVLDTVPATVFTVLAVLISISDGFLKPLLLGRGVDIPMLVVLLGAIGGMLAFGILGLFVGAVVLAVSYKLMMAWLHADNSTF